MSRGDWPDTRSPIHPSTTGMAWRWRCAASRSRTFRCATRASISPIAGMIYESSVHPSFARSASMLTSLLARLHQGHRTMPFPDGPPPPMVDRFRGRPWIDSSRCPSGCDECAKACPTSAITIAEGKAKIDLGRCLFCTDCVEACPEQAIAYTRDHRLAVLNRRDLIIDEANVLKLAAALNQRLLRLFGRSLKLRHVSAGGCNACEADV